MRHGFFALVSKVSLLLCIAVTMLWARSELGYGDVADFGEAFAYTDEGHVDVVRISADGVKLVRIYDWMVVAVLSAMPTLSLLVWWNRRRRPGTCSMCGYNLTGNTSGTCPECGTTIAVKADALA